MVSSSPFANASSISQFLQLWFDKSMLPEKEQAILESYYGQLAKSPSDRTWAYYDAQTEELMTILRARSAPKVLEVGCGCGTESLWMGMHSADVHAIDIKPDRLRVAESRKRILDSELGVELACRFQQSSMLALDEHHQYDTIWMEQAFHHLEPREMVLDKLMALLAPGGYVVISETNALNPLLQIQLLAKRGFKTIKTYTDEDGRDHLYGNERIVSGPTLRRTLERRGLQSLSLRHYRVFPHHHWLDSFAWLESVVPAWLYPIFTHYNYVGQKVVIT